MQATGIVELHNPAVCKTSANLGVGCRHAQELENAQSSAIGDKAALITQHQDALAQLRSGLEQKLADSTAAAQAELARLTDVHEQSLASLQAEAQQLLAEQKAASDASLEAASAEHDRELSSLKAGSAQEHAKLLTDQAAAMSALEAKHNVASAETERRMQALQVGHVKLLVSRSVTCSYDAHVSVRRIRWLPPSC